MFGRNNNRNNNEYNSREEYNRNIIDSTAEEVHEESMSGQDSAAGKTAFSRKDGKKRFQNGMKRHMNAYARAACCALIVGAISGSMIVGSFAIGNNTFGSGNSNTVTTTAALNTSANTSSGSSSSDSSGGSYTVSQIASKCTSSVVAITNKSVTETQNMFGQTTSEDSESAGSGVIIAKTSKQLLIATNYHVIEDAESLTVCFNDSKNQVYKATVKGTDESNDLAVIAVNISDMSKTALNSITVATIGDSTQSKVGDQVVAIGNALGSGQSVTSGYISAMNRSVTTSDGTTAKLIQTDAAINPGNSGGALFNMKGELIGINSAKYSDTSVEGMGFAIPMSKAEKILNKLMNETSRTKLTSGYGYLGIYGQDVDSSTSEAYNIPSGVYVSGVIQDSAAEKAGIQKGDIITKFDGSSVSSMSELSGKLQYYKAGEKVKVTLKRSSNGKYTTKTVTVTLDKSESSSTSSSSGSSGSSSGNDSSQYSQEYGSQDGSGSGYGNGYGSYSYGNQMQ